MSYPGNAALGPEIKERLLRTFSQTLDLAAQGGVQEAQLGCDFILRMDPLFEPARVLHERLAASTGTVRVDDLRGQVFQTVTATGAPATPVVPAASETSFAGLDEPESRAVPAAEIATLRRQLESALAARDFRSVLALAERDKRAMAADPTLHQLVETAHARLEAEPYAQRFLDAARQAVQAGHVDEVSRLLDKTASLDPTHPGLDEVREMQRLYSDPDRVMGGRRRGIAMDEPLPGLAPEPSPTLASPPPIELDELTLEDESSGPTGLSLSESEPPPTVESMPVPPAAAPPRAAAPASSESDPRITALLDEGQAAFDRGEYQGAIDAWSRIFLIDIDHAEAAKRIEAARRLKAEAERKVEEVFQEGVAHMEAGAADEARACFDKVLEMQPNHLAAREYLQQLDAGKVKVAPRPSGAFKPGVAVARSAEKGATKAAPLKEEILVPPEPGEARKAPAREAAAAVVGQVAVKKSAARRFALLGAVVLILAGVGGFLVWQNRDHLFPNSKATALPATPAPDALARATTLHGQGKTAVAISLLRRLPPEDPLYPKAQALIAQWEAAEQKGKPPAPLAPEEAARRDQLIEAARQAYGERRYLRAATLFDQAAAVRGLDGAAADLAADAKRQVAPLEKYVKFYKDGEWEITLRELWREHERDPGNRDIAKLMVDSYYNLGVRDLQREAVQEASEKFREALALDPQDRDLQRMVQFVDAYKSRSQDLLYRTFVKYLSFRA